MDQDGQDDGERDREKVQRCHIVEEAADARATNSTRLSAPLNGEFVPTGFDTISTP